MKKLMCAVAALAAGVAMAEGIASANVVGYATKAQDAGVEGGSIATGLMFAKVTGNANLNDLQIKGYDPNEGYMEGEIALEILDENGYAKEENGSWLWYDGEDAGETYYGWYDESMGSAEGATLEMGDGVWISIPDSSYTIQSAGQVFTADLDVTLNNGSTMVANPYPIESRTYDAAVIKGYDPNEGYMEGEIALEILDENGYAKEEGGSWLWYDGEDAGETYFGWYDEGMSSASESTTLKAGQGLWISVPDEGYSVSFTGITL